MTPTRVRRRRIGALVALPVLAGALAAGIALALGNAAGGADGLGTGSPTTLMPSAAAPASARAARAFRASRAARTLTARLTLPQLVAQLFVVTVPGAAAGGAAALAGGPGFGGVLLTRVDGTSAAQATATLATARSALTVPGGPAPLLAVAQEGGPQTAIPDLPPRGEAELGARAVTPAALPGAARRVRREALAAARALRAVGATATVAPLADVDAGGGPLAGRLFGNDPEVVGRLAAAAAAGYARGGIIAVTGHYPGSGAASADPDLMTATVGGTLSALAARDLIPFAALARRVPVVQMSNAVYAAFDGVTPASLLPAAVDLLRTRTGFGGVVLSGDLDAALQATGGTIGAAARRALDAGDDLLLVGGPVDEQRAALAAVLATARRWPAEARRVRLAALRVLTLKDRYGLLGTVAQASGGAGAG